MFGDNAVEPIFASVNGLRPRFGLATRSDAMHLHGRNFSENSASHLFSIIVLVERRQPIYLIDVTEDDNVSEAPGFRDRVFHEDRPYTEALRLDPLNSRSGHCRLWRASLVQVCLRLSPKTEAKAFSPFLWKIREYEVAIMTISHSMMASR